MDIVCIWNYLDEFKLKNSRSISKNVFLWWINQKVVNNKYTSH